MKAKLVLPLLLLFGFTGLTINAQEYRKVRFSVLTDPHVNWLHTDAQKVEPGPVSFGFGGGLRMDYYFQSNYVFTWGVQFNQTGGSLVYQDTLLLNRISGLDTLLPGARLKHNLQYVEIPIAIRLMTQEIGYTTFFSEFGLDPCLNNRALISTVDGSIEKDPYQHEIAAFNLAYHIGVGIMYSFGPNLSLIVGLNYKNTFLDITRDGGFRDPDNVRVNQAGLMIGIVF